MGNGIEQQQQHHNHAFPNHSSNNNSGINNKMDFMAEINFLKNQLKNIEHEKEIYNLRYKEIQVIIQLFSNIQLWIKWMKIKGKVMFA